LIEKTARESKENIGDFANCGWLISSLLDEKAVSD
jgi:hypothetical protein